MDKECQRFGAPGGMAPDQGTGEVAMTLFLLMCFATLVLVTLTEQFALLPATLAAHASAWFIMRL